jgi:NAD(P)-dependent dehydrogenase (short-subunit alcohol dehydrogenase family)
MRDPVDSSPGGMRLVVGANRGIGLALTEAQLADPAVTRVVATCRPDAEQSALDHLSRQHGAKLQRWRLDATDAASLKCFEKRLCDLDGGIDVAIHAAGILHAGPIQPEKSLADCEASSLTRLFQVNSIAPLMVARAVLAAQDRQQPFVFAALSAMVGSIGDNRLGGWYGYRASKAALNQFIRTLAIECRSRFPRGRILAIHPGTTDTALSQPFQRSVKPGRLYSPAQSAGRIMDVIGNSSADQSGRFLNWDGSEIPW